jgi:alpha-L-arabinofuranosidase
MKKSVNLILLLLLSGISFAQTLTVKVSSPKSPVQPTMWGIFFEDINFSADGGLYAELVKNRSFEFDRPMMGWKETGTGKTLIINRAENRANPRYAHITVDGTYDLVNEGFRGMGIEKGIQYNFSIMARVTAGNVTMNVVLVNDKGADIGHARITPDSKEWKKYTVSLTATETVAKGRLRLAFSDIGELDADMISLFPANTWRQRPGGLRADLVQLLADLHPGFVRFPGGCIVEGRELTNRYQWKNTVGKVEDRTLIVNRWNTEFANRAPGDYFQSYGLGFFEYFQLAEDIGAAPLPIINCGMACQFNSAEVAADEDVDTYIQDALDLIEFANGSTNTKWGKLRAEMGHSGPFNLRMIGVGNEQWDSQYIARYKRFEQVLKSKYPEIKLVSSSGPSPQGEKFDYLWSKLRPTADLIDEHYYMSPDWFLKNARRYDNYDRKGPKIFAGEYAAHIKDKEKDGAETRNTWGSALAEAAFMTGLERNADVVHMASYAPLLAHVDAWQWRPDLIWFDNLRSVGTPNYYVQKLFGNYKGTQTVPVLSKGNTLAGEDSLYASATIEKDQVFLKIVNVSDTQHNCRLVLEGVKRIKSIGVQLLTAKDKGDFNTLDNPGLVEPVFGLYGGHSGQVNHSPNTTTLTVAPNSLSVFVISYQK